MASQSRTEKFIGPPKSPVSWTVTATYTHTHTPPSLLSEQHANSQASVCWHPLSSRSVLISCCSDGLVVGTLLLQWLLGLLDPQVLALTCARDVAHAHSERWHLMALKYRNLKRSCVVLLLLKAGKGCRPTWWALVEMG